MRNTKQKKLKESLKIVRDALLASYNTDRPRDKVIYLEDCPEIWIARAKKVIAKLDEANGEK